MLVSRVSLVLESVLLYLFLLSSVLFFFWFAYGPVFRREREKLASKKPIVVAVGNGNRQSLIKLIHEQNPHIDDAINDQKETLLHVACQHGHLNIVRTLVEVYCCDVGCPDKDGNTPLAVACSYQHIKIVSYLCLVTDWSNPNLEILLKIACQTKSVYILKLILRHSFKFPFIYHPCNWYYFVHDKNMLNQWMEAIALKACCYGHLPIINFLFSLEFMFDKLLKLVPALITEACKHQQNSIIEYLDKLLCDNPLDGIEISDIHEKVSNLDLTGYYQDNHAVNYVPALFLAVKSANHSLFKQLLSMQYHSQLIYDTNSNNETLMHAACVSGDLSMVERIYGHLKMEFLNMQNECGNTCLHIASEWGFLDIIKYLIMKGCQVDIKNKNEETPFHLALRYEHIDACDFFLEQINVDVNAATSLGETPLHLSSTLGLHECTKKLLAHPKCNSLDLQDKVGNTPVLKAVRNGDLEMVQIFSSHNCKLLTPNKFNDTIFHVACQEKMKDILSFTFERISSYPAKLKNIFGRTLLHIACVMPDLEMVNFLSHQKQYAIKDDINVCDDSFDLTPLQYACMRKKQSLFKFLVNFRGFDGNAKNKQGFTAFHLCCKNNLQDMARLCFKHCLVTVRNREGDTPLHLACKHKNFELAFELMQNLHNTKLDTYFNYSGSSVLHVAAGYNGAFKIIKYMIEEQICACTCKSITRGETALHVACNEGILENAEYLFKQEYDHTSHYNDHNETPLYLTLFQRNYSFLREILPSIPMWQLEKCCIKRFFQKYHPENAIVEVPLLQSFLSAIGGYHSNCSDQCQQFCDICIDAINLWPCVVDLVDSEKCTMLHYLACYACKSLETLVDKVISLSDDIISKVNSSRHTSLHIACHAKNEFMIYKLLQHEEGYKLLHQKDASNKTPADLFRWSSISNYQLSGCIVYLAAHGADMPAIHQILQRKSGSDIESTPSITVVVIGNSSVGKTTLVKAMKAMLTGTHQDAVNPEPTTGIVTDEVIAYNKHCYNFFDFAGQVEFETSHSQRLENLLSVAAKATASSPYIFLLLTKGTDSWNDSKKQVEYWYMFLSNHLRNTNMTVKVALACSHDDLLQNQERKKRENNIQECLQYLDKRTPLNFNVELHQKPFFLNCKETHTISINSLLRYFDDAIFSYKLVSPKYLCIELKDYLETHVRKPCQVEDLIRKLKECRQFKFTKEIEAFGSSSQLLVPQELNELVKLLIELFAQKDIILLKSSDNELSWWIINKCMQNVLFSEVSSIFSPSHFKNAPDLSSRHNTGVIPCNMLSEIFKNLSLSTDLIEKYLLCMGHCKIIEDKEVLNLICGEENAKGIKHLFFPGLIKADKSAISFPEPNDKMYHCGWLMESRCDLSLRFLHSLLLNLTFKFSCDVDSSKYSKRLCIWKCGLFWSTLDGSNVLVEVQKKRMVFALFRCFSDQKVLLSKLRFEVIHEIREVLHGSLVSTEEGDISEYFLFPPPKKFHSSEDFLSQNDIRHPFIDFKKAFKNEHHSRSIYIDNTPEPISSIFGFDSFVPLKHYTLSFLKSSISDNTKLKKCFNELKSKLGYDALEIIFQVDNMDEIHEEWMEKNKTEPLQKLCSQLEKYSVFKLSDLDI